MLFAISHMNKLQQLIYKVLLPKKNERHTAQQPINCCFDSIQAKEAGIRSLVLIDEQGGKYD